MRIAAHLRPCLRQSVLRFDIDNINKSSLTGFGGFVLGILLPAPIWEIASKEPSEFLRKSDCLKGRAGESCSSAFWDRRLDGGRETEWSGPGEGIAGLRETSLTFKHKRKVYCTISALQKQSIAVLGILVAGQRGETWRGAALLEGAESLASSNEITAYPVLLISTESTLVLCWVD